MAEFYGDYDYSNANVTGAGSNPLEYFRINTFFENISRYKVYSGNGATVAVSGGRGLYFITSATAGAYVNIDDGGSQLTFTNRFLQPNSITIGLKVVTRGTDYEWYGIVGLISNSSTGASFTNGHYGFRLIRQSSGNEILYATSLSANGGTLTQTDITTISGFNAYSGYILQAIYENNEIKFYVNGILSATHTGLTSIIGNNNYTFNIGFNNLNVASDKIGRAHV